MIRSGPGFHFFVVLLLLASTRESGSRAATLHVDDFQSSSQGWISGGSISRITSGGPGGDEDAFLRVGTTSPVGPGSHLAARNSLSAWTGNYTAVDARVISLDMMVAANSPALPIRIVLFDPTASVHRYTSTMSQTVPNDGVWRNYEFLLDAASLTRVQGTISYETLMAGVGQVMVRYNPGTPSAMGESTTGVLNFDNIALDGPPELARSDFDGDFDVDGDDLATWESNFGVGDGADTDDDGDTDGRDVLNWQREYTGPGAFTAKQVVPEPATISLLTLCLAAVFSKRPRKGLFVQPVSPSPIPTALS
jgi:hypothetical protein